MHQLTVPRRSPDHVAVTQHEVLRLEECEVIRDRVFALSEYWTQRSECRSFFTLGAAAYLDAPLLRETYLRLARARNPVLRGNFGWLYERLQRGFEEVLGQPVGYDEEIALPGFHIFVFHGDDQSPDKPSNRAHFDLQWMHAMPSRQPEETLSFTVLVEEPSGGSSMEIWPACFNLMDVNFDALHHASTCPSHRIRYSRGGMIVHDGLVLHAIGVASIATPEGYRITLQGHGIKTSDGWVLYW